MYGELATKDKDQVVIKAWPDADLNGDWSHSKSTSGRFIELVGANSRGFPLMWACHKQTATSLCTAESETVSLKDCMKADAIAIQELFALILTRPVDMQVFEDNTVKYHVGIWDTINLLA